MSEIDFLNTDAKQVENELIQQFEQVFGETLYPGDERRIFLLQQVPVIVGLKNAINDSARQNLLRYARGEVLDELGKASATQRIAEKKAVVTLRFTLSVAQPSIITIPQGTRVTPDGKIYFATVQKIVIPAGQMSGDGKAECMAAGKAYNGFTPGQISTIVDPIPFVASVANMDTSTGGADIEDDDSFRERIRLAPESLSVAGPEGAYIYWAKTADQNIGDISVTSPTPGTVKVVVLMKNGEIPTQSVLDSVAAVCSDKKRRPLTDNVLVSLPTTVQYAINLTYYISSERNAEESSIRAAIENIGGAVDQYKAWQSAKLGRAINPDHLRQLMLNVGANKINMTAPIYTSMNPESVAVVGAVTINYGGMI